MTDFFSSLFDTSDFPARWNCGRWTAGHGWLHIVSDLVIFGAYLAIPVLLVLTIRKRKDLPFQSVFALFAVFILACGTGHLVEALIYWHPVYRFAGLLKLVTAVASVGTVLALVPILPKVFALRSPAELEREIQERRVAEAALRERELELSMMLDSARDFAIVSLDKGGRLTSWSESAERITGFTSEQVLGQSRGIFEPAYAEAGECEAALAVALQEGRYEGEEWQVRSDGTRYFANVILTPMRDDRGELQGYVQVARDITERHRAESALEQRTRALERSNDELDRFAYVASHDLKAPLRAIDSLAGWIIEDAAEALPDESREHLDKLLNRVQRMEALLDEMLEYSRAGRIEFELEDIDLRDLVESVIELVEPPEGFRVEIAGDLPVLNTARAPLAQVLRNLLSNAIKHGEGQGRVVVSCTDLGSEVEFSVQDDGPGIAPRFHEQIFEMFKTLQPRDKVEGTGMGLAVVKKTVESFGGSVRVESEEGEGARFLFTWSKSVAPATAA